MYPNSRQTYCLLPKVRLENMMIPHSLRKSLYSSFQGEEEDGVMDKDHLPAVVIDEDHFDLA